MVEKPGVEKFMVENSGVERSGVEMTFNPLYVSYKSLPFIAAGEKVLTKIFFFNERNNLFTIAGRMVTMQQQTFVSKLVKLLMKYAIVNF